MLYPRPLDFGKVESASSPVTLILFHGRHFLVLEQVYYLLPRFNIVSNRTISQYLLEVQIALGFIVPMATYTIGLEQWGNMASIFRDGIRLGF